MSKLLLAPMEGLADDVLRKVLTCVGGYDQAVTEFVRVSGSLLPSRTFTRISPELLELKGPGSIFPLLQMQPFPAHCPAYKKNPSA